MNIREQLEVLVNPSPRKLTLFACSCIREIGHLLNEDHKNLVKALEAYVDGLVNKEDIKKLVIDSDFTDPRLRYVNEAVYWSVLWMIMGQNWIVDDIGNVAENAICAINDFNNIALTKQNQLFDDIFNEHS